MSPDMIDHYLETQGLSHTEDAVEEFRKFYSGLLAAFPDVTAVIHNRVAEGDLVATCARADTPIRSGCPNYLEVENTLGSKKRAR
jgi:hypothetical protein